MHERCTIHADIATWERRHWMIDENLDRDVFWKLNFDALCGVLFIVPYLQDKYH